MVRRHHRWKRAVIGKLALTFALGIVLATASQAWAAPTSPRALHALGLRWQAEATYYTSLSARAAYVRATTVASDDSGLRLDIREVSIGAAIGLGVVLAGSSLLSLVGTRRAGPNPGV
jgi:hypothetical protein